MGELRGTIEPEVGLMRIRPGSVVRGQGVMRACVESDAYKRSPILLTGFAVGWFLNRPGLQVVTYLPDAAEPWKRATVPFTTSVGSWSAVMLAAVTAVRRTKVPAPVAAVLLGGALVVVDSVLADLGEARNASRVDEGADEGAETAEDAEDAEVVDAEDRNSTPD